MNSRAFRQRAHGLRDEKSRFGVSATPADRMAAQARNRARRLERDPLRPPVRPEDLRNTLVLPEGHELKLGARYR
jgi:hypothetical protein